MEDKTIKERLAILETKMSSQIAWMKVVIMAVLASTGVNLAI